jgi:hypothetical protein
MGKRCGGILKDIERSRGKYQNAWTHVRIEAVGASQIDMVEAHDMVFAHDYQGRRRRSLIAEMQRE